jgi:uncharacterized membrane protein
MMKIQYGIAGFFAGAFIGLLLGLIERRIIDNEKHPAALFFVMALTVIVCGIAGMVKGLHMAKKKG